jgi:hypothetical protein
MNTSGNPSFNPRFVYPGDLDDRYTYVSDSQELYGIMFNLGRLDLCDNVTGAFVLEYDGDYAEVYVTDYSGFNPINAQYERIY